jgi:tetratricopeptide (TPR) repeat protein
MRLVFVVLILSSTLSADNWKNYNDAGSKAREQKNYAEAEKLLKKALVEAEKTGPDDVKVALSLNQLALTYADQKNYATAEDLLRRCVGILEKKKPQSRELGRAYSNLGWVYQEQHRYGDAEPLHKKALKLRTDSVGSDHFEVALTLEDLGFLYQAEGRLAEAEQAFDRSLEIWERTVGTKSKGATLNLANLANHPEMAQSLYNAGVFYYYVGKYREAEPLLRRCLEIQEQLFGRTDERVADTARTLARVEQGLENYREAEPLLRQAVDIYNKRFGLQDPMTAVITYNLGTLYVEMQGFAQAEPLLKRAQLLLDHSRQSELQLAGSLYALGNFYLEQRNYETAEPFLRHSLEIQERDPDDPKSPYRVVNLGIVMASVARSYSEQGHFEEAEPLFKKATSIFDGASLGQHPSLAVCLKHYAAMLRKQGRESEAAPLESRIQAIRSRLGLNVAGG